MDNDKELGYEGVNPIDGPTELIEDKNGRLMRKQPTKAQYLMRVQQVVTWLLDGFDGKEVREKIKNKWGITTRPAEYMINAAREQIETMAATESRAAMTLALLRLTELYDNAIKEGDHKVALDIIKTQNRMLGLNAPERLETTTVQNWDSMTVTEQLEHVGNILERAQKQKQLN